MENSHIIVATAEIIVDLKRDLEYYRTMFENEQRKNTELLEQIANLMTKYAEMEDGNNAENALETAC
jgi:predicted nuclease with TOPRIM domain